jgi:hypothetical protein
MVKLVQYCSLRQSSFGEVSLVLKVDSDISVAHLARAESCIKLNADLSAF